MILDFQLYFLAPFCNSEKSIKCVWKSIKIQREFNRNPIENHHILKIFHSNKTERENTVGNRESQNPFKIGSRPRSADLLPNIKAGFDWKIYFRVQKQLSKNRSICLIFIGFGSSFAGAHFFLNFYFFVEKYNFENEKRFFENF